MSAPEEHLDSQTVAKRFQRVKERLRKLAEDAGLLARAVATRCAGPSEGPGGRTPQRGLDRPASRSNSPERSLPYISGGTCT
jgi:hypothetical protein